VSALGLAKLRPRSTRRETVEYGVGYFLFAAGRLLRDVAVARILGPAAFGVWSALLVYRQYTNYSDLGFTNGLGRILPKLLKDGKAREASRAMGASWVVAMAGTTVFALAMASWFLPSFRSYSAVGLWGIATVTALMFIDKQYMYSCVVFRSTHRVGESGLWMGLLGLLELALGILLTRRFGLYGLFVSASLAALTTVACMYVRQPLRGNFGLDRTSFHALVIPSVTLMGLGLGNIAIHNVDRLLILWAFGPGAKLGQYQLAASLSLVVSQLPYILLTVLVPKLFRFGRESRTNLRPYFLLPTAIVAILGVVVGSVAWISLPAVLPWMLPKYSSAAPLVRLLLLGEVYFAIAMVPETVMVASDRGLQSLWLRCFTIGSGLGVCGWALSHGYGLSAVAGCMCAAQATGALMVGWMAAHATKIPPFRYLLVACAPVLYAAVLLTGISRFVPEYRSPFQTVLTKLVVCGLALSPLAAVPLWFFGVRLPGMRQVMIYLGWSEVA
jgi:hypothetical protein